MDAMMSLYVMIGTAGRANGCLMTRRLHSRFVLPQRHSRFATVYRMFGRSLGEGYLQDDVQARVEGTFTEEGRAHIKCCACRHH